MKKLLACLLLALSATSVRAAVVISIEQTGSDVTVALQSGGSLNMSGMLYGTYDIYSNNGVMVSDGMLFGPEYSIGSGGFNVWEGDINGPDFGAVDGLMASSNTNAGEVFGFSACNDAGCPGQLFLADNYVSGAILPVATMTFANQTIESMGLLAGEYTYTLLGSGDTITVNVVPIPAAVWLFGSALFGLGCLRRVRA